MINIKMYRPNEKDWEHGQDVIYLAKKYSFGSILYTFGYASVELYWECTDSHSGMTAGYNKETDHEHKLGDIIVTDYDEEYVLKMCLSGETEIDTIAYMADVDEYMNSLGETE